MLNNRWGTCCSKPEEKKRKERKERRKAKERRKETSGKGSDPFKRKSVRGMIFSMPRKPRFFAPDVPIHVVQRGHNREPVFFEEADYLEYLFWLKAAALKHEVKIHAYVLMTNHIHLLATPFDEKSLGLMMQAVGRRYVPYVNHKYGKSGSLWEGRYKANLVDAETYLLTCMRYIELNPVRAAMVTRPENYAWSSYSANALGQADDLISPHLVYLALGADDTTRLAAYRALFEHHIDEEVTHLVHAAWQTGTPLGNERFKTVIENRLKCKVGYDKRGRPKNPAKFD